LIVVVGSQYLTPLPRAALIKLINTGWPNLGVDVNSG
jgi:hypothetical protein